MIKTVLILGLATIACAVQYPSYQQQPGQYKPAQGLQNQQAQFRPIQSSYQARPAQFQGAQPQYQPVQQPRQPVVAAYQAAPLVSSSVVAPVPVSSSYSGASSQYSQEQSAPTPFAFSYDSVNEDGTKLGRQESGNEQGVVSGQYSIQNVDGTQRVVIYTADENGFHATVQTNEPGTLTSNPADVQIQSSYVAPPAPAGPAPQVQAKQFVPSRQY